MIRVSQIMNAVVDKHRLNFSWLIKLRWSSIVGQTLTIVGVYSLFGVALPIVPLSIIILLEIISNLYCVYWLEKRRIVNEYSLAGVMVLDIAFLTALLFYTGGPSNPFSFLYLVQIALATVVLKAYWTWSLVGLSLIAFALLFLSSNPLDSGQFHRPGMWVALAVASAFIVHFLLRITAALASREEELAEARNRVDRQTQLASLATVAAGAAHELATPLGTIALVAKEISRAIDSGGVLDIQDVELIRQEVTRCREILDQMSGRVGEQSGEGFTVVKSKKLMDTALEDTRLNPKVLTTYAAGLDELEVAIPINAVAQAIRNVITNAQDASDENSSVEIFVSSIVDSGGIEYVSVQISDRGCGMSSSVKKRAVEPFFTTKSPGRGMGLGLFLSQTILDNLGGSLRISSNSTVGTRVTIKLPIDSR